MRPTRYRSRVQRALFAVAGAVAVVAAASLPARAADTGPGRPTEAASLATHGRAPARPRPRPGRPQPILPSRRPAAPPVTSVRYTFDAGLAGERGALPLTVGRAEGGVIMFVRHGTGRAVQFPAPCVPYGSPKCPRVFLQSVPAPGLNPGTRGLRFGADILLGARRTTKGENILQKGYSVRDSQFKLQVDGVAGRPSCVLIGVGSSHIYYAVAGRSVADGQWHKLECVRSGGSLTVAVDNKVVGRVTIPTTLSVYNKDPLRIGAKGGSPNNDQFNGVVDDVYAEVVPQ